MCEVFDEINEKKVSFPICKKNKNEKNERKKMLLLCSYCSNRGMKMKKNEEENFCGLKKCIKRNARCESVRLTQSIYLNGHWCSPSCTCAWTTWNILCFAYIIFFMIRHDNKVTSTMNIFLLCPFSLRLKIANVQYISIWLNCIFFKAFSIGGQSLISTLCLSVCNLIFSS